MAGGSQASTRSTTGTQWTGASSKPNHPRHRWNDPDKVIKYEVPAQQSTRAIFLDGSEAIDWPTVQTDVTTPRLWTEGAKKAGAALTEGYAAIALPVSTAATAPKTASVTPSPRSSSRCRRHGPTRQHPLPRFDQDEKPKTRRNVAIALSRFGQLLIDAGCHVRIVRWQSSQGKGIDDLIANHGPRVLPPGH